MKSNACCLLPPLLLSAVLLLGAPAPSAAEKTNPVAGVINLLSELEAKLISDGEAEEKAYKDFNICARVRCAKCAIA